jgi:hypothetical protein
MAKAKRTWTDFYADCDTAVEKATKRAGNLTSFAGLLVVLALLVVVGYVAAAIGHNGNDTSDVSVLLGATLGTTVTLLVLAAVLFGLGSLVDISGKRLAIQVRADRAASHHSPSPTAPTEAVLSSPSLDDGGVDSGI